MMQDFTMRVHLGLTNRIDKVEHIDKNNFVRKGSTMWLTTCEGRRVYTRSSLEKVTIGSMTCRKKRLNMDGISGVNSMKWAYWKEIARHCMWREVWIQICILFESSLIRFEQALIALKSNPIQTLFNSN